MCDVWNGVGFVTGGCIDPKRPKRRMVFAMVRCTDEGTAPHGTKRSRGLTLDRADHGGRSEPGHREGHPSENVDEHVNPFWSQRVQVAARVEGLRPTTLPLIPATPESLPPVPADEWDQGEQTPRPVQALRGAEGRGDGVVRSQGRMPMAFETPQSWDSTRTPGQGHGQPEVFRVNGETAIYNLLANSSEYDHQSACAGIPQVDLLGPLGSDDGRRGKGQGGFDQPGDGLRSQGVLRLDQAQRGGNGAEQRHPSLDLLGDVHRGSHGDVPIRGRGQHANGSGPEHLQRGVSRQRDGREQHGQPEDRPRKDHSRPRGQEQQPGRDQLPGESHGERKKIPEKDQGPTLEQDLSSLLVQQLIQENEDLQKKILAMERAQQQGQQPSDELDTSRTKVTPGGTRLPEGPPPIEKKKRDPTPPPMPPVPPLPWGDYEAKNEEDINLVIMVVLGFMEVILVEYLEASLLLRQWKTVVSSRYLEPRCLPDATLLIAALDKVDTRPNMPAVQQLYSMMLAETEMGMTGSETTKTTPAVKTLNQKDGKKEDNPQKVCRFWKSDGGCRNGACGEDPQPKGWEEGGQPTKGVPVLEV
eukprot:s975_g20.t1